MIAATIDRTSMLSGLALLTKPKAIDVYVRRVAVILLAEIADSF